MKLGTATLSTISAAALAVALLTGTAGADPGNGHANGHDNASGQAVGRDHDGDADASSDTSYTEDTDTNDGGTANNVADDGDNQHPSGRDRSVEHGGSGNQGRSESAPDEDGHGPERDHGGTDKPNGPGGEDLADQDGNNGCGNDDDFEDDNEGWCGRNKPEQTATTTAPAGNQGQGGDHASSNASPHADDDDADDDDDVAATGTYPAPTAPSFGGGSHHLPVVVADRLDTLVLPTSLPTAAVAPASDGAVLGLELENTPSPRGVFATSSGGAVSADLASTSEPASATSGVAAAAAGALAFTGDHLFVLMAIAVAALAVGAALVTRARRFEA